MREEIETFEQFKSAVNSHDLTHMYSDDGEVWRLGSADLDRIHRAAEKFPQDEVERVWNAMVDQCLVESARPQFYWKRRKAS